MNPRETIADSDASTAAPIGRRRAGILLRWATAAILAIAATTAAGFLGFDRYRARRLAEPVRTAFAETQYNAAREPLKRWLEERPQSGEAHYYEACLALVEERPEEAARAFRRALDLGFDRGALEVLQAIFQSRAGHRKEAEPVLLRAFAAGLEPRAVVARELARIFLETYRLPQAIPVVERYRELMPADPRPYLWRIEIGSRTGESAAVLIRNYRDALERDPGLDKARLGLAEQLSKDRRYDEAEEVYRAYLRRNPVDAAAIVGLGRNAFQSGNIDAAILAYESALKVDPRQPGAIKELAQLDIRFGRYDRACNRFEQLTRIEPYDHEYRYAYAQALKLAGRLREARTESERADRLRDEQGRILQLRSRILSDPNDIASRFEVARWMLTHGHEDEGLKWANEVLRLDSHHAPTHQALADYYADHGNPGLANYHRAKIGGQDAH